MENSDVRVTTVPKCWNALITVQGVVTWHLQDPQRALEFSRVPFLLGDIRRLEQCVSLHLPLRTLLNQHAVPLG